jgi:hypothetical protein
MNSTTTDAALTAGEQPGATGLAAFYGAMSGPERRTFWACFSGWALDGMDFMIYPLVIGSIISLWQVDRGVAGLAVTATLLASAFGGGGSELSTVEFAPGAASLTPVAKEGLDKVAKALAERPALKLTVSGESRLETERDAWKREHLQQLVRSEKRRQAIAGGAAANAEVTVADAEYPALLKEVYKSADIVKPKNIVGFAKDVPAPEMEALLLASLPVPDDAMQQLAVGRAVVVRDYLASKDLPTGRLFLGAPKTAPDDPAWKPRADLMLAVE